MCECVCEYISGCIIITAARWLLLCSAAEHVARLLTRCRRRAARDAGREMMMHQEQSLSLCLFRRCSVCVSRSSTAESEIFNSGWLTGCLTVRCLSAKRDSQGPISATAEALSRHSLSQRARCGTVRTPHSHEMCRLLDLCMHLSQIKLCSHSSKSELPNYIMAGAHFGDVDVEWDRFSLQET